MTFRIPDIPPNPFAPPGVPCPPLAPLGAILAGLLELDPDRELDPVGDCDPAFLVPSVVVDTVGPGAREAVGRAEAPTRGDIPPTMVARRRLGCGQPSGGVAGAVRMSGFFASGVMALVNGAGRERVVAGAEVARAVRFGADFELAEEEARDEAEAAEEFGADPAADELAGLAGLLPGARAGGGPGDVDDEGALAKAAAFFASDPGTMVAN